MKRIFFALLLIAAPLAFAQQPATPAPREPFPNDYKRNDCAPLAKACISFPMDQMVSAAHSFRGLALSEEWMAEHAMDVVAALQPVCAKAATCYTTPGTTFAFCNDAVIPEMRGVCAKQFPANSFEREQCSIFVELYTLGIDMRSRPVWDEAQACAKQQPQAEHTKPLDVWVVPATIPHDYTGSIIFYAIDPDTHIPVSALVTIEGQTVWSPTNPIGVPGTYYPFKWPVKLNRVANAEGHRDAVAPKVTIHADGYPDTVMTMPVDSAKLVVTLTPSPDQLKRGKNIVTATAVDEKTGKPVEARVRYGSEIAGFADGKPFEINVPKKGERPEIWAESLFGTYGDVVIAPAKR
ncbi:MAG TPA: hypothetical protein VFN10_23295 [Thermoanaerobaculia bacterium]|nr:hypothetical protein [Thermoanaerobaculia bacterium]